MMLQLKRIFDNIITCSSANPNSMVIKSEPVHFGEASGGFDVASQKNFDQSAAEDEFLYEDVASNVDEEVDENQKTYFTQRRPFNNQRRIPNSNNNSRFYSSYSRNTGYGGNQTQSRFNQAPSKFVPGNRQNVNRRDLKGNISKCTYCKSIMHYFQNCPHVKRNDNNQVNDFNDIQYTLFQSTSPAKFEELKRDLDKTVHLAIIDCGCTCTVIGDTNYTAYVDTLSDDKKIHLQEEPSNITFKFGDNPLVQSYKRAFLPVNLNGVECLLKTEVVKKDIPLLLSKNSLKRAKGKMNYEDDTIEIFGRRQPMIQTPSGHYGIEISTKLPLDNMNIKHEVLFAQLESSKDKKKIAKKLHTTLGHPKSKRLIDMIKKSGQDDLELFNIIQEVEEQCDVCKRWGRPHPKPAVTLPLASVFNETVAVDLKVYVNNSIYFLHLIDHATRFSQAVVIRSKDAETVVTGMFTHWISLFGRPEKFLTDNGGEFCNHHFMEMCHKMGIKVLTTASESPWSNGMVERHNGIIGEVVNKVIEENKCSIEVALSWAINAKNSLHNIFGFSPYQLVLGRNPILPCILNDDLPALENSTSSKIVAQQLDALHSARKAFEQAQASSILKRAIRAKTRTHSNNIFINRDKVFYKKGVDEWKGPGTVLGQEGAQVLIKDGSFLYRVHTSRLRLVNPRSDYENSEITDIQSESNDNTKQPEKDDEMQNFNMLKRSDNTAVFESEIPSENLDPEENIVREIADENPNSDLHPEENLTENVEYDKAGDDDEIPNIKRHDLFSQKERESYKLPKVHSSIKYKNPEDSEWIKVKIISKGGKANGENWSYTNVEDLESGRRFGLHISEFEWKYINPIAEENVMLAAAAKYYESRQAELKNRKDHQVYIEVEDRGQPVVTTKWVDKEKNQKW